MNRITIYGTESGESVRLGWFDLDAATEVLTEDDSWDGNNKIGNVSGMQINRAALYRTSGGRWAANADHRPEFNGPNVWEFLTDDEARDWMLRSGGTEADEAIEKWFPETPEEAGPGPQGGRPAVGPAISVAYPRELLDRIDEAAREAGQSRAEWLRNAAENALTSKEN